MISIALHLVLTRLLDALIVTLAMAVISLVLCRIPRLAPFCKVWILRLCGVKMVYHLLVGTVPYSYSSFAVASLPLPVLALAFSTWAYGVGFYGWRAFKGLLWTRAALRSSIPAPDQLVIRVRQLGVTRRVRIATSAHLPCAAVTGALRPVLLVPSGTEPGAFELAHEAAHIKHHDLVWWPFQVFLGTVFWFVPGTSAWLGETALAQEEWADQAAKRVTNSPPNVAARAILGALSLSASPLTLTMSGASHRMKRRINAVLGQASSTPGSVLALCAIVAVGAVSRPQNQTSQRFDDEGGLYQPSAVAEPLVRVPVRAVRIGGGN